MSTAAQTSQVTTPDRTSQVTSAAVKPEPKVVLSAVELAEAQSKADDQEFPAGYKESLALLAEMTGRNYKGRDLELHKPVFRRLKAHISKLQQGLPTIPQHANDHAASYASRNAAVAQYRLDQLARTNPEVKAIIAERNALKAAGTSEQQAKDLEAARAAFAEAMENSQAELRAVSNRVIEMDQANAKLLEDLKAMTSERDALASAPKAFDGSSEKLVLVIAAVREAKSLKEAREKVSELTDPPAAPESTAENHV